MALRVYVLASGLQQRRRHRHKIKPSNEGLKMDKIGGRPARTVNEGGAVIGRLILEKLLDC